MIEALSSSDLKVRERALSLSHKLESDKVIKILLNDLLRGSIDQKNIVKKVIARLNLNELAQKRLVETYREAKTNAQKIDLIEVYRDRFIRSSSDQVRSALTSEDDDLKKTALKALENTSNASDVESLLKLIQENESSRELKYLRQGLKVALLRSDDLGKLQAVINLKNSATKDQREALLYVLSKKQNAIAIQSIEEDAISKDAATQKMGIKYLAAVSSIECLKKLNLILKDATPENKILGIRAIVQGSAEVPKTERVSILENTLKLAVRDEEKMLIKAALEQKK